MRLIPRRRNTDLDEIEASADERLRTAKAEAARIAAQRKSVRTVAADSARLSEQNSISSLITRVIVQGEGRQ